MSAARQDRERLGVLASHDALRALVDELSDPAFTRAPLQLEDIRPGEKVVKAYPQKVRSLLMRAAAAEREKPKSANMTEHFDLVRKAKAAFFRNQAMLEMLAHLDASELHGHASPRFCKDGLAAVPISKN